MLSPKTFLNISSVLCIVLCFGYSLESHADNTRAVRTISVNEIDKLRNMQDIVIVDVRTARSWWRSSAKIPGAVRGDPTSVKAWEPKYAHDKILILYCS